MIAVSNYKNRLLRFIRKLPTFGRVGAHRFLLISTENLVAQGQIFPFYFYQADLLKSLNVSFSEIPLATYSSRGFHVDQEVELVLFQPWFDIPEAELHGNINKIRREFPRAKIAFLDCFAPLDLRFASRIDALVDIYIKKQLFLDRAEYTKSTQGDTNLVDFYGKLYGIHYDVVANNIPEGFLQKLLLGPGFVTSKRILPDLSKFSEPPRSERAIDVHARLGGAGEDWYGQMRKRSIESVKNIAGLRIQTGANVPYARYLKELKKSKICFSPFGFGEVCWRDYEAVLCGALLIKPDMSHIETYPDIFKPFHSYIPVNWDFSDLEEKILYYIKNEKLREQICWNAYAVMRKYVEDKGFIKHIDDILKYIN